MAAASLVDVRRRMKNVRAQLKRCREKDCQVIEPSLSSEILMVYAFSGNDLDAAAEFFRVQKPAFAEDLEDYRRAVEDTYMRRPTHVVELMNDDCLARYSLKKMASSCRFITELRLYNWLVAQNCDHGVAPCRLQMVRCLPAAVPSQVRERVRRPLLGCDRLQHKWLQRFRLSWGAKLGKPDVQHTTPQHAVQEKDRMSSLFLLSVSIKKSGPKFGTAFGGELLVLIFGSPFF